MERLQGQIWACRNTDDRPKEDGGQLGKLTGCNVSSNINCDHHKSGGCQRRPAPTPDPHPGFSFWLHREDDSWG